MTLLWSSRVWRRRRDLLDLLPLLHHWRSSCVFTTATRDTKACEGGRGLGGGTAEGWVAVFRRRTVFFFGEMRVRQWDLFILAAVLARQAPSYLPPALQWLVLDRADKIVVLQEKIVIGFSEPEISEGSLPGSAPVSPTLSKLAVVYFPPGFAVPARCKFRREFLPVNFTVWLDSDSAGICYSCCPPSTQWSHYAPLQKSPDSMWRQTHKNYTDCLSSTPLSAADKLANIDSERPYCRTVYFNFHFLFEPPGKANGSFFFFPWGKRCAAYFIFLSQKTIFIHCRFCYIK